MAEEQQNAGLDLFEVLGDDAKDRMAAAKPRRPDDVPDPAKHAIPEVKKKAEELGVQLAEVEGTGIAGGITVQDVKNFHNERKKREAEEKRKQEAEAAKKRAQEAQKRANAAPKKQEEPEEYDKDRFVSYAGHRIEIPRRNMKLEEVRQMIEEQFPELSKERTEMLYDEELGLVIPVLKGHRKGSDAKTFTVLLEPPKADFPPVCHVIGEDGVYEVRSTQAGIFVAKVLAAVKARELARLRVPQIPLHVLRSAISYFREKPDEERLLNIVWSYDVGRHGLQAPEQEGTAANVDAAGFVETDDTFIVLQLHSHGRMPAFFSATDDADEVRTGFYGVVGRCDAEVPEMMLRYSCGGMYRDLAPGVLFEDEDGVDEIVEVLG